MNYVLNTDLRNKLLSKAQVNEIIKNIKKTLPDIEYIVKPCEEVDNPFSDIKLKVFSKDTLNRVQWESQE